MRIEVRFLKIAMVLCLAYMGGNWESSECSQFLNPYPMSDPAILEDMPTPPAKQLRPVLPLETSATWSHVRVGYVIPSNRSEQPRGIETIRYVITTYQNWVRDQMKHHGQGQKTFVYETEPDGVTLNVHVIHVAETDDYIREDIWGRTLSAVSNAGVSLWQPGEVWLFFVEAHVQNPDGDIEGGVALGASWGSGDDPGVAMLGGDGLAILRPEFETDDRRYHDTVLPEIGPYPLKQDVSFAWFEGETYSSVHSSWLGAGLHELGHAFGLPHDFRNDENFHGNLMTNGLRGIRGCIYPGRYPGDFTRLSHVAALIWGKSRYFNAGRTDVTRPSVSVSTQGDVYLTDGLLPIQFSASDDRGLATAFLTWQGDGVAEIALRGLNVSTEFTTEYFEVGASKSYSVAVYDLQGNKASQDVAITALGKSNLAPRPFVKVTPPVMLQGESFTLDASNSSDPDQSPGSLLVEWDLDGDGVFDTAPSSTKTITIVKDTPGCTPIRAKLTDEGGASTISTAVFIDPHRPVVNAGGAGSFAMEWESSMGFTYQVGLSTRLQTWSTKGLPLLYGDSLVHQYNSPFTGARALFFRLQLGKREN